MIFIKQKINPLKPSMAIDGHDSFSIPESGHPVAIFHETQGHILHIRLCPVLIAQIFN